MERVNDLAREIYVSLCNDTGERQSLSELNELERKLASNPKRVFSLPSFRLGVNAAVSIAKRLESEQYTVVDLFGNLMRDVGFMAILQLVKNNALITDVNVGCNDIGREGAYALAQELEENSSLLHLELGSPKKYFHHNYIDAVGATAIANALVQNETLEYIGLNRNLVGRDANRGIEAFAEVLEKNTTLQGLRLGYNYVSADSLTSFFAALKVNTALTMLDLSGNKLGHGSMSELADALPFCALRTLYLSNNKIRNMGAEELSLPLKDSKTLELVDLSRNEIEDYGAIALASAMRSNGSLHVLNLSENEVQEDGANALALALTVSNSLQALKLNKNYIGTKGAVFLAAALLKNESLRELELNSCRIGDEGILGLASLAQRTQRIRSLLLGDNFLTEAGGRKFVQLLSDCTSIDRVDVHGNQCSHATLEAVKKIIRISQAARQARLPKRLEMEVFRLQFVHYKLRKTQRQLAEQIAANEAMEAVCAGTEDDIVKLQNETEQKTRDLRLVLAEANQRVEENIVGYDEKVTELAEFKKTAKQEIKDLKGAADEAGKAREKMTRELEETSETLDSVGKEREKQVSDLRKATADAYTARQEAKRANAERRQLIKDIESGKVSVDDKKTKEEPKPAEAQPAPAADGKPPRQAGTRRPKVDVKPSPADIPLPPRRSSRTPQIPARSASSGGGGDTKTADRRPSQGDAVQSTVTTLEAPMSAPVRVARRPAAAVK